MDEKILEALLDIKKELKDIHSILEPPKFVPEDSNGKHYENQPKPRNINTDIQNEKMTAEAIVCLFDSLIKDLCCSEQVFSSIDEINRKNYINALVNVNSYISKQGMLKEISDEYLKVLILNQEDLVHFFERCRDY